MLDVISNFILKLKAVIRLINLRNIRLFFFTLRQESLKSTLTKVFKIYKNRKSIEIKRSQSFESSGNQDTLLYNFECALIKNDIVLLYGWFHSAGKQINFQNEEEFSTINIIRFERKDVAEAIKMPESEALNCGFLIKFPLALINKSSFIIESNDGSKWAIDPNFEGLFKKSISEDLRHWINYLYSYHFLAEKRICNYSTNTLISIVTPVYNTDPEVLNETVQSVLEQSYPHWQLCLYDDGSKDPETLALLEVIKKKDERIHVKHGPNKGMVYAYNKAIEMAEGEWIVFLDHDDKIHFSALCEITKALSINPEAKLIYTDEDIIDVYGMHVQPSSKAGFSIDKLLKSNYINHLTVIKKDFGDHLGWLNNDYEGAQDYDLLLRAIEILNKSEILYVDKVLYHWRQSDSSINYAYNDKEYVIKAGRRALQDYCKRNDIDKLVIGGNKVGTYKLVNRES